MKPKLPPELEKMNKMLTELHEIYGNAYLAAMDLRGIEKPPAVSWHMECTGAGVVAYATIYWLGERDQRVDEIRQATEGDPNLADLVIAIVLRRHANRN
jgi:hypothetical protein